MSYHIIVNLPSNRDYKGSLKMYDGTGSLVFGPVDALGRGTNKKTNGNDHTDWIKEDADTPTGVYAATVVGAGTPTSTYGSYKRVSMDPTSGNALKAKQNGRSGIMIHGGNLTTNRNATWYPLNPTYGCIRISNSDQKKLIDTIASAGGSGKVTVNNEN